MGENDYPYHCVGCFGVRVGFFSGKRRAFTAVSRFAEDLHPGCTGLLVRIIYSANAAIPWIDRRTRPLRIPYGL